MKEIFKDIKGYKGDYKISNLGRVKSFKRYKQGKILKYGFTPYGYPKVTLYKGNKSKTLNVHRLLAIHFIKNPKNKPCVNHIDNDPTNNALNNLERVTVSENTVHGLKYGNGCKGEKHYKAKLNKQQVLLIRKTKGTFSSIANIYGISNSTVADIKHKRSWRHI